jgi:hypothetical protein
VPRLCDFMKVFGSRRIQKAVVKIVNLKIPAFRWYVVVTSAMLGTCVVYWSDRTNFLNNRSVGER